MTAQEIHKPVLLEEAVDLLDVRPGGLYVDCTVGMGGHASEILRRLGDSGLLIGFDRDPDALAAAAERLSFGSTRLELIRDDFRSLPSRLAEIEKVDGFLFDLGVSSLQLDDPERGFSLRNDGPLDMRMDRGAQLTAADLVNTAPPEELARIFREFGEEPSARRIAAAIVQHRRQQRLTRTSDLAGLIERIKGTRPGRSRRIHPATQVFQALRIAINKELEGLEDILRHAIGKLGPAGRIVVISFHSLEDRIVKKTFQMEAGRCVCKRPADFCTCTRQERVRVLTRRPMTASKSEVAENPRARSAKLRAIERSTAIEERRTH